MARKQKPKAKRKADSKRRMRPGPAPPVTVGPNVFDASGEQAMRRDAAASRQPPTDIDDDMGM